MAVKSAVYDYSLYTPDYYLKGFLAGGVCCSVTHGGAIAGEMGFYKLATQGLGARCIMIGGLTAGQFAIFDSMLPAIGIDKFHYHEPLAEH